MKINIPIESDKELRDYVKNLIDGQVKTIVRKNLESLVKNEVLRLFKNTNGKIYSIIKEVAESEAKHSAQMLNFEDTITGALGERIDLVIDRKTSEGIDTAFKTKFDKLLCENVGEWLGEMKINMTLIKNEK